MAGQRKKRNSLPSGVGKKPSSMLSVNIPGPTSDGSKISVAKLRKHQLGLQAEIERSRDNQEDLQSYPDRFQELYNSFPLGYFALDKDLSILEANTMAASLLATTIGVLLKSRFSSFVSPTLQFQNTFHLHAREVLNIGSNRELETEMQRVDGSRFYAHLLTVPGGAFSKPGGQLLILVTDITAQKKAQKALNEIEERLSLAQIRANIGVWDWDMLTGELHWSEQLQIIYGQKPGSIRTYNDWRKLVHPDDIERFEAQRDTAIALCQPFDLEYRILHPSGAVRWINVKGTTFYSETGQPLRITGINIDITGHKKIEEDLSESRLRLQIAVDSGQIGIHERDLISGEIKWDDRMYEFWGLTPAAPVTLEMFTKGLHPDDRDRVQANINKALDPDGNGQYYSEDRVIGLETGVQRWIAATGHVIFEGRRPLKIIGTAIDITDRKLAQEALASARDELEIEVKKRTRELAEANKQLKQYGHRITQVQEEERKRIAYELHDDTAQYLSILKMEIESLMLSGKIESSVVLDKLEYLRKDAERALDDVRRYSHELRPGVLEHLGLQAALEQIADDINKLRQVPVELHVEGAEPEISEDLKLAFFRVAQEALNNARKHSRAGKVDIILGFTKNHVQMAVSDDGVGFNVKEASKRSGIRGSLGLMSMRERANLINANLKIESATRKGTRVTLTAHLKSRN
jgi:PAS domain S-box-containing protein